MVVATLYERELSCGLWTVKNEDTRVRKTAVAIENGASECLSAAALPHNIDSEKMILWASKKMDSKRYFSGHRVLPGFVVGRGVGFEVHVLQKLRKHMM